MYNFINEDIKIDKDKLPKGLKDLSDKCELADLEDNYGLYENLVNVLVYTNAKEAYRQGHITKQMWRDLEMRYEL